MNDVNAFVLAGGHSRRMGADKALIELDGQSLLQRALAVAGAVANGVWIVGSKEKFATFGSVIEDEFGNQGPLAGIHAALRASTLDLNVILAVDTPFVEGRLVDYLLGQARKGTAVVTAPRAGGRWQPLCAVYRREFAKIAEGALRAGKNKIGPLFAAVEVRAVEEAELIQHGFSLEMFRNLNTPEELSAARKS
jgi:molybdopterin-guanine dinucleotide biosynthesis protein A